MSDRRAFGRQAEHDAAEWLARKGFRVIARNFRARRGEIDVVCEHGDELVFVEVRARRGGWVGAVESVDGLKRRRIEKAAEVFLSRYRGPAQGARFDVVAWDGSAWDHREDAWP